MQEQIFVTCLRAFILVPFLFSDVVADERPEHFEGKEARSVAEATANISKYNTKLREILSQSEMTPKDIHTIHQLTYTLENALKRIESEIENTEETLEDLHLASEAFDDKKIRLLGNRYLDRSKPFEQ